MKKKKTYIGGKYKTIDEFKEDSKTLLLKDIDFGYGSGRLEKHFDNLKLRTVFDVLSFPINDLLKIKGFGRKCLTQLESVLGDHVSILGSEYTWGFTTEEHHQFRKWSSNARRTLPNRTKSI